MILRVNVGTDNFPEWVDVDAHNARLLNGVTLDEILNTAEIAAEDAIEEAQKALRKEIAKAVKKYHSATWLTEDATTEDIVKYFVQK